MTIDFENSFKLASVFLGDVIFHLKHFNGDGVLTFKQKNILRSLSVSQSKFCHVNTNAKNELVGAFLLKLNEIKEDDFNAYFEKIKTNNNVDHWTLIGLLTKKNFDNNVKLKTQYLSFILLNMLTSNEAELTFAKQTIGIKSMMIDFDACVDDFVHRLSVQQCMALCPNLNQEPVLLVDPNVKKNKMNLPITSDERGLLTVIENNPTLNEIFSSSFLEKDLIHQTIVIFWLKRLIVIKSKYDFEKEDLLKKLSKENLECRNHVFDVINHQNEKTYYEYFKIVETTPPNIIGSVTQKIVELYASPAVDQLFLTQEKNILSTFLNILKTARDVLLDPSKRMTYHQQLAKGQKGPLVLQDVKQQGPSLDHAMLNLMPKEKKDVLIKMIQANPLDETIWEHLINIDSKQAFEIILNALMNHVQSMNLYDFLGVSPSSIDAQIHQGYRKRSKYFHPDRQFKSKPDIKNMCNEFYKKIVHAYSVLKDPQKRKIFDQSLFGDHQAKKAVKVASSNQVKMLIKHARSAMGQGQKESAKKTLLLAQRIEPGVQEIENLLEQLS